MYGGISQKTAIKIRAKDTLLGLYVFADNSVKIKLILSNILDSLFCNFQTMTFDANTLTAAAMGIALSASCGFRVFIPMLVAGLASRFQWFHFAESFSWLSSTPTLISLSTASVLEIAAYYIPFVDNILDTIATPLSMAAGTVMASSILPIENEWLRWMTGIVAGGGGAGLVASGTGLLRLLSSKFTLGTGNAAVATVENTSALAGSIMSFIVPVIMAIVFFVLFVFLIKKLVDKLTASKESKIQH